MLFTHSLFVLGFTAAVALSSSVSHQHAHFHYKRQNVSVPIAHNTSASNPSITDAEAILAEAVAQQGVYNTWRVENPQRNSYRSRHSSHASANRRRKRSSAPVAPHLNATIVAAAALIAHRDALAQAANGTLNPPTPPPPADFGTDTTTGNLTKRDGSGYWVPDIPRNGLPPMGGPGYPFAVYRDVTDPQYAGGAKGDGIHDDTAAINAALSAGNNCGLNCLSSSLKGTIVYFPPGTYLISTPLNAYYYSQLVGHASKMPTIKTSANFIGLGAIQTDVYVRDGGTGPTGEAAEWYIEQSNFYRQIRNFIIDIRATTTTKAAGLHWQVAQATSLQNVMIYANSDTGSTQIGMFTENGSSGFMSDVFFYGGQYGLYGGNQQYTVRSFHFTGQHTAAICLLWDWGWTWSDLSITNVPVGILIVNPEAPDGQQAGSTYIMDTYFQNVFSAVKAKPMKKSILQSSVIALDNCVFSNVLAMVDFDSGDKVPVPASGAVDFINFGNVQAMGTTLPGFPTGNPIPLRHPHPSLLSSSLTPRAGLPNWPRDHYFVRSRPQYEGLPLSSFLNVKSYGAKGDGQTDDTDAIRRALQAIGAGNVLYFPTGSYIITSTITLPKSCRITGRIWSQLVARGPAFSDVNKPTPMIKAGNPGESGSIEISDILFTSIGALPGLVLLEWNIAQYAPGTSGLWDTHFRVGGAAGTKLSVADCPPISTLMNNTPKCWAAAMMLHITPQASGYFENMWAWVADHDLDDPKNTQVSIGVGRGILIESQGPVWMYGTASEHSIMYQYNFYGAKNVFAGMIQTESPYYQGTASGVSPGIWGGVPFPGDPVFKDSSCTTGPNMCDFSWAVIASQTTNLTIAGAGIYSWFDNYDQSVCVDKQNCQQRLFLDTGGNDAFVLTNMVTIGSVEMITNNVTGETVYAANNTQATKHPFWSMLALYLESSGSHFQDCDDNPDQDFCDSAPICDYTIAYNDVDDLGAAIKAGTVHDDCINYYTLGALQNMLTAGINNISDVANGYDEVYSFYIDYLQDSVDPIMQKDFLNGSAAGGGWQYFDCQYDNNNANVHIRHGCPFSQDDFDKMNRQDTATLVLMDHDGFFKATEDRYGLTEAELSLKNTWDNQALCWHDTTKDPNACDDLHDLQWVGYPTKSQDFRSQIVNPKDVVLKSLGQMRNVSNNIYTYQIDMILGNVVGDMDDVVQVVSSSVFMFLQSVDSMARAKELGKQQGETEKKDRIREILGWVFMALSMIPDVSAVTRPLTMGLRILGELGNSGQAIQAMVEDPSTAPQEVLAVLTGGGASDLVTLGKLANFKRALTPDNVGKLGSTFKSLDTKLHDTTTPGFCKF